MKKAIFLFSLLGIFCIPFIVSAHPGRTAKDGCHYCRTNCDSWGVPWNKRHCHNPKPPPPPSCPSMSSYDSLSGSCKCYSGYTWNNDMTICIQNNEVPKQPVNQPPIVQPQKQQQLQPPETPQQEAPSFSINNIIPNIWTLASYFIDIFKSIKLW